MDDEEDVLGRFMFIMDQYYRVERGGGRPDYMFASLERVLQSPAAIEQDFINQLIMINIGEDELMTPLQDVYEYGYLDLFEIFLKNGADPNTRVVENHVIAPESILMYCIRNLRYNLIEYVKLLLKYGADVNYTNNDGTVLHYAAQNNNIEATRLILKYFPDTSIRDDNDDTAEDIASILDHHEIFSLIDNYRGRRFAAATRIQKQTRGRRTLRNLNQKLIEDKSRALGLPESDLMEPYISPIRNRRKLMRTLAKNRRQQTIREDYRTARFLRELEGGRRRRKRTRKKYRYRV
jgi:hypothetical protein